MKNLLILLLFVFAGLNLKAQEKLNQHDSVGKKDGTWIIYYDSFLNEVKDTSKASYYRYTRYAHGFDIFTVYPHGRKNWKLEHTGAENEHIGRMKQLEGEYKWVDKKGITRSVINFSKGYCTIFKAYNSNGALDYVWDFTLRRDCQPGSSSYYDFNKKGELARVYYQQNDGKPGEGLDKSGWTMWGGDFDCLPIEIDTLHRTDTLSSLKKADIVGKKNGKYKVYYDSILIKTEDSNKAYYYGYAEYINGFCLSVTPFIGKDYSLIYPTGCKPQKGKIKALDGEFTWVDKKTGKARLISTYKDGNCTSYKRFTEDGNFVEADDFTKKYKGVPNSYTFTHNEPGGPKRYWMRLYDGDVKQ